MQRDADSDRARRDVEPADASSMHVESDEIEGGSVSALPEVTFDKSRHHATTASRLAFMFAWILAAAIGLHYVIFMVLAIGHRDSALASLGDIFNVWLPALVGIVSAAATYYFTKDR